MGKRNNSQKLAEKFTHTHMQSNSLNLSNVHGKSNLEKKNTTMLAWKLWIAILLKWLFIKKYIYPPGSQVLQSLEKPYIDIRRISVTHLDFELSM